MDMMDRDSFENAFYAQNPPGVLERLKTATVGIAGAGGLGSNIAVALTRAGVHHLIIADFDRIELSNLNRQQYFPEQAGMFKTEALKQNLNRINPYVNVEIFTGRISPENVETVFGLAELLVEAFDLAEMKAMLVRNWLSMHPDRYIVTASGIAGLGRSSLLKTEVRGRMIICGDGQSSLESEGGYTAPRVAIAANLQASAVIEILCNGRTDS
ncbi:MAG: sulfur carrier protein ThiS adenylyltransferase ThiF [Victivallaceae bacterium]|jgi:sulfur carrier protein ThiS adenylyltransferase